MKMYKVKAGKSIEDPVYNDTRSMELDIREEMGRGQKVTVEKEGDWHCIVVFRVRRQDLEKLKSLFSLRMYSLLSEEEMLG